MRFKYVFLVLSLIFVLASCNKSEKEIEDEVSSGVVLIQNESYYEIVLSNGESLFFSGYDEEGDMEGLAFEEDSVQPSFSYGTGFFVSDRGLIATNAHVVSNKVDQKQVNKSVKQVLNGLKALLELTYADYQEQLEEAQRAYDYANVSDEVSYDDFYKIRDYKQGIEDEMESCENIYSELDDIDASESELKYHRNVSIAYNDTYVTNTEDFCSCVVVDVDSDNDLALIQLKDKSTPDDRHVFAIADENPLETYSFSDNLTKWFSDDKNSKLFMTGFNLGPTLAITSEGIKSQFNNGTISQTTAKRLMYSIPALPGSSGSPVVNLMGELVAINYAGINGTQNFNYGIRVKYLKDLIDAN